VSDEVLARIERKLDLVSTEIGTINVSFGRMDERLRLHIEQDAKDLGAIESKIGDMRKTQRWWAGKFFGAAATGGGLLEFLHRIWPGGGEG